MIARRLAAMPIGPTTPRADPARPGLGLEGRGDARHLPPRRHPPPGQPSALKAGARPPGRRRRRRLVHLRPAARPLAAGPAGPRPGPLLVAIGGASRAGPAATSASTCATARSATSACSTSTPRRTARLCWDRMLELAAEVPELSPDAGRRPPPRPRRRGPPRPGLHHPADALDDHDRLAPGVTADEAGRRIGAVGADFLPRDLRPAGAPTPSAAAARSGSSRATAEAKRASSAACWTTRDLAGPAPRPRAAPLGKPLGELRVAIKPTLHARLPPQGPSPIDRPRAARRPGRPPARLGLRRRGRRRGAATSTTASTPAAASARWPRYFGFDSPQLPPGRPVRRSRCRTPTAAAWARRRSAGPGRRPTSASPSARCAATRSSWPC